MDAGNVECGPAPGSVFLQKATKVWIASSLLTFSKNTA